MFKTVKYSHKKRGFPPLTKIDDIALIREQKDRTGSSYIISVEAGSVGAEENLKNAERILWTALKLSNDITIPCYFVDGDGNVYEIEFESD